MKEDEIVRLLRSRDEAGAAALLKHYGPLMRYIIAPILSGEHDREDCLSEAAMRVWEKIGQFDGTRGSWTAWLTAVTRNTAWRYAQTQARHAAGELAEDLPSPEPTPEELTLRWERQEALRWAMKELRPLEGKLYRARQRLRKALGGGDGHA